MPPNLVSSLARTSQLTLCQRFICGLSADEKKLLPEQPGPGGWDVVSQPASSESKPSAMAVAAPAQETKDVAEASAMAPAGFDEDVIWEDVDADGEGNNAAEDDDVMWEETL